jgi:hypothetical protein
LSENLKGRNHPEDLGIDRRIILKLNLEKQCGRVRTIHLGQDRDQCQAFVNMVMNFWVP